MANGKKDTETTEQPVVHLLDEAVSETPETVPETVQETKPVELVIDESGVEGRQSVRIISAKDWEAAGVPNHEDTWWDQRNNWTVRKTDLGLTEEQYNRIIVQDRGFRRTIVQE